MRVLHRQALLSYLLVGIDGQGRVCRCFCFCFSVWLRAWKSPKIDWMCDARGPRPAPKPKMRSNALQPRPCARDWWCSECCKQLSYAIVPFPVNQCSPFGAFVHFFSMLLPMPSLFFPLEKRRPRPIYLVDWVCNRENAGLLTIYYSETNTYWRVFVWGSCSSHFPEIVLGLFIHIGLKSAEKDQRAWNSLEVKNSLT